MADRRKEKCCLKRKVGITNLILGKNIQFNEIAAMQQETLVGRFLNKRLFVNTLRQWTTYTFFPVLGYVPKCLVLARLGHSIPHWTPTKFLQTIGLLESKGFS
jgi:hypothetical protein